MTYQHTSREAYLHLLPRVGTLRRRVLSIVAARGSRGISTWQVVEEGIYSNSAPARMAELKQMGLIEWNGQYSISPTGERAMLYVAVAPVLEILTHRVRGTVEPLTHS